MTPRRALALYALCALCAPACDDAPAALLGPPPDAAAPDAGAPRSPPLLPTLAGCTPVDDGDEVDVGAAAVDDEHALALEAQALGRTAWGEEGNEAVILELLADRGLVGHLVLHQGYEPFTYTMHLGHLGAGERVRVRASPLTAAAVGPRACVAPAELTAAGALGDAAEGLVHAPLFQWPIAKRFDDLPVVVGWSAAREKYEVVYTNEDGGTPANCGGGAAGMAALIARFGRGFDIEGAYSYGSRRWGRCTGTTSFDEVAPRLEGAHPIFYYGDGHNRLFESRAGYGKACGAQADQRADGDLPGWNVASPGAAPELDAPFVVTLRPLPVPLDPLGYGASFGRREGLADGYAPWLYRLTDAELRREGKLDGLLTLPMERYLFVDVLAADVGGVGDGLCPPAATGGFELALLTVAGARLPGPRMTASFFGGAQQWKRLAIPLDRPYAPEELAALAFDARDGDGIYLLAWGDALSPRAAGDNGATLSRLHQGEQPLGLYVDDDDSGCDGGVNAGGPPGGPYPCGGGEVTFAP